MTVYMHHLAGCAPTPLAWYLKGLGVLRLVAEQKDEDARGFWRDEAFHLATRLTREELERFILCEYQPSVVVNPWGARSGFYGSSSERTSRELLARIESEFGSQSRGAQWLEDVRVARDSIATLGGKKPESAEEQRAMVLVLRRSAGPKLRAWLDACVVPVERVAFSKRGEPYIQRRVDKPPILGTGGNEGSGSYTAAFMAALDACLVRRAWDGALIGSLFGNSMTPTPSWNQSFGQFAPGVSGNPWDVLLAFEGAGVVRSGVTSRDRAGGAQWSASPFYVAPLSAGYGSSAPADEQELRNSRAAPGRGEQWFPLWSMPGTLREVEHMFAEGRADTRGRAAATGVDVCTAIASQGVQRGISVFVRYGYLQRNNLATHFAVPLGRVYVAVGSSDHVRCLDDLTATGWIDALRRAARRDAPASILTADRRLDDALMAAALHPDEPGRWQSLLVALAEVERRMLASPRFTAERRLQPIPPLRAGWVQAADDGRSELRLALALASQAADPHGKDRVRAHWLPLDKKGYFAADDKALRRDPRVVCLGLDPLRDCIALVRRRLVEGVAGGDEGGLPLHAPEHLAAPLGDIAAVLVGEVDLGLVCDLARPLMALRWRRAAMPGSRGRRVSPDDLYALVRLACLPYKLPRRSGAVAIPVDPAIIARLAAGDLASAGDLAIRRLTASGLRPRLRRVAGDAGYASRLAASLAFPIAPNAAAHLADRLIHSSEETTHGVHVVDD